MSTTPPTRIFVTGHRGQLGHDLMDILGADDNVTGADLPELDIAAPASVTAHFDNARPDVIVNAAAFTRVDACETEREAAWRGNVEGPRVLAALAARRGARLIHISTDYVFDGQRAVPQPYLESDATAPASYYGITKREGEQAVETSGAAYTILRTAWLYGANGSNFPKTILKHARLRPDTPLKIVNDQFGSPTWSRSLARQIAALIPAPSPGIYHATSEGYCTWYTFARRLFELLDFKHEILPCTTADYPTPARRPANSILENQRLKQAGLNQMPDWQNDLATFVHHHASSLLPPL